MKLYTKGGDDGSTQLRFGERVPKDSPHPIAYGSVDEAQAALGLARSEASESPQLHEALTHLCRDLWVIMAELSTPLAHRTRLTPGKDLATESMVAELERLIDEATSQFEMPRQFTVPGQTRLSALLDNARTVVRRAERSCTSLDLPGSHVVPYLNRLADLTWAYARWSEERSLLARDVPAPNLPPIQSEDTV